MQLSSASPRRETGRLFRWRGAWAVAFRGAGPSGSAFSGPLRTRASSCCQALRPRRARTVGLGGCRSCDRSADLSTQSSSPPGGLRFVSRSGFFCVSFSPRGTPEPACGSVPPGWPPPARRAPVGHTAIGWQSHRRSPGCARRRPCGLGWAGSSCCERCPPHQTDVGPEGPPRLNRVCCRGSRRPAVDSRYQGGHHRVSSLPRARPTPRVRLAPGRSRYLAKATSIGRAAPSGVCAASPGIMDNQGSPHRWSNEPAEYPPGSATSVVEGSAGVPSGTPGFACQVCHIGGRGTGWGAIGPPGFGARSATAVVEGPAPAPSGARGVCDH